jgi:serine/threonine-protein kinase
LAGCLAAASPSFAQNAAADVLFDEGRKLMAAGHYEEAIPKLKDSYRLEAAAGTLLNLAECYVRTNRTASAWSTYREAAAISASMGEKDRERYAEKHADELKAQLSMLTIVVEPPSRVPGLAVGVNGTAVPEALWGQPFPVDPGTVSIDASAPGKRAWHTSASVKVGADAVTITLPALEDAPVTPATVPAAKEPVKAAATVPAAAPPAGVSPGPAESKAPSSAGSGQRLAGFITGGAGLVGVGVGTALWFNAEATIRDAHCPNQTCVIGVGNPQKHEQGRSEEKAAVAVLGVGGAAVVTGVILLLTAPSRSEMSDSGVSVGFDVGPRGSRLLVGGAL